MTAALEYGKVTARYLLAVADGPDADRMPDSAQATGTVTFTPTIPTGVRLVDATPPATVIPLPVVCTLNAAGVLVDPTGSEGVWLVATDYRVTVLLEGFPKPLTFPVSVPAGGAVDLLPLTPLA